MNIFPSDPEIISAFRSKGFRATSQRIAIYRNVLMSREHPTAQRIYENVKKTHPTVSLATVYKTLSVLRELNLIQDLSLNQGETRFEPNLEPHINLFCERCGDLRDTSEGCLKEIIERVVKQAKFIPARQSFVIYGFCEKCSKLN